MDNLVPLKTPENAADCIDNGLLIRAGMKERIAELEAALLHLTYKSLSGAIHGGEDPEFDLRNDPAVSLILSHLHDANHANDTSR